MTNPVHGVGSSQPFGPTRPAEPVKTAGGNEVKSFKELLLDNLDEVNRLQQEADQKVQALYSGETDNVADVFAAINKAGIAFDLLMEIRNKLMQAYEEIQQMRV